MKEQVRQLLLELKEAQEDSGMTQSDIARKLHKVPSAISSKFRGNRGCSLYGYLEIADVLGYELVLRKKNDT